MYLNDLFLPCVQAKNGFLAAFTAFLIAGCAPPSPGLVNRNESSVRSFQSQDTPRPSGVVTVTQLPAGLAIVPVLVPDTLAPSGWDVPTAQETKRLLDLSMPPITDENRQVPVEQVIEGLTGRRLLWVPPDPQPAGRGADAVTYGSEAMNVRNKTLGQYLRGLIGGGTSLGYPKLRMARMSPAAVASAPFGVPPVVRQQPELMDVIVVTRTHIVIVAVPKD
jgi:hypothetical protein